MSLIVNVNANAPQDTVCMGVLAKVSTQYLVMDRCCGFLFEQYDCLEFVSQFNSLKIVDAFDNYSAAHNAFEAIHEATPKLVTLTHKPFEFESLRTVEMRDHCGGDNV